MTVQAEMQVPTDHTKTDFETMTSSFDVSVRMQPCQVSTYKGDQITQSISQHVGDPAKTDGAYSFMQIPSCGYEETVTIVNLPDFVTHNEGTSDFTVEEVTELSLMGRYVVGVRSEICVPDDYTQATCTVMAFEYDLEILIEPCIVDTFTATKKVQDISYHVGEPGLTAIGSYKFDENPVCNYQQTVTLTNLPSFITHNDITSDFTLPEITDLNLIGSYMITIRSEIQVPEDYT